MGNYSSGIHKDIIPLLYEKENGSTKRGDHCGLATEEPDSRMGASGLFLYEIVRRFMFLHHSKNLFGQRYVPKFRIIKFRLGVNRSVRRFHKVKQRRHLTIGKTIGIWKDKREQARELNREINAKTLLVKSV